MPYSFRIKFRLPISLGIGISESELIVGKHLRTDIILKSQEADTAIEKARWLVLRGNNYASEEAAKSSANYCMDAMIASCARLNIGVDFGRTAPKSFMTLYGLQLLEKQAGIPLLNDIHGLMTFEDRPGTQFISLNVQPVITTPKERFIKTMQFALKRGCTLSEKEHLAFDLFGTSFFQASIDAGFLMLMMAIETLLQPAQRSILVQQHLEEMIRNTRASCLIDDKEKNSIIGALRELRKESIGQAGKRLAGHLGDRSYNNEKPAKFFARCYKLRSQLVHGSISMQGREEIRNIRASLSLFVGDLLAGPLLALDL